MTRPRTAVTELAALFRSAPQPIYVLDDQWVVVFCNEACLQWIGPVEGTLVGRRCRYHSSPGGEPLDAVAAALCPPPTVAGGIEIITPVVIAAEQRLVRFVPLGATGDFSGVLAIADCRGSPEGSRPADSPAGFPREDSPREGSRAEEPPPEELHRQIRQFRARAAAGYRPDRLVGQTAAMVRARAQVEVAVASGASVLIVGPPGSGRQHLAQTIHYGGDPELTGALVPLACCVLGADLLLSTVRASLAKAARNAPSTRDTLLLGDADQLPAETQQPLCELLQARSCPLRLIATTSQPLAEMVRQGQYRAELMALLSTITIELPPLAARREDLPLLAQLFLEDVNAQGPKQLAGFTPEALTCLDEYPWSGNLDELAKMVEEAHQRADGPLVSPADLPPRIHLAAEAAAHPRRKEETIVLDQFLGQVETELIRRALARSKGNKAKAARLLGLTRPRLYRRMIHLGLAEDRP
jgi:transcriptional regulator with AAA-type ATPase domain